jgi:AraC-like DNA-binding protein
MMKNGQNNKFMDNIRHSHSEITPISFKSHEGGKLDFDIIRISELRKRANRDYFLAYTRIEFHQLIFVEQGHCIHIIDFEPFESKKGSLLLMQPAQVQRFDPSMNWQGFIVIFRPEFLLSQEIATTIGEADIINKLENLPIQLKSSEQEEQALSEIIQRMFADIQINANLRLLQDLLRSELQTLLNRLYLVNCDTEKTQPLYSSQAIKRLKSFRDEVEKNYYRYHHVSYYTQQLPYSEKSLNRAVQEITGGSAKKFLSQRLLLEAKRLLAYTDSPIGLIALKLGFEEATNFSKFFRINSGCSPSGFRKQNRA